MKRIYLDYASTTPLDPRVRKVMEPFLTKTFGNPSSIHAEGAAAKKALDSARASVARSLEARPSEVVFTSGGTESNNLSIFGAVAAARAFGIMTPHIVTTNIEHASVLEPVRELVRREVAAATVVPVESNGIVEPEKIIAAIRPSTALVSVMYANNEIGTIQPIRKIGQLLTSVKNQRVKVSGSPPEAYPLFHTDACQAPLYLMCLVNALGVDLLALDGHKIYGPKGIGCLYVRRGTPLEPELFGGGQERGARSTTENVPGIAGFSEALTIAAGEREAESARILRLRDLLYFNILQNVGIEKQGEQVMINGSMKRGERLPNNINVSFPGVDSEMLALRLDAEGIAAATKSSCQRDERESYVVRALGGGKKRAESTLRLTLGRKTVAADVLRAGRVLAVLLQREY